jgi:hypothetical protein
VIKEKNAKLILCLTLALAFVVIPLTACNSQNDDWPPPVPPMTAAELDEWWEEYLVDLGINVDYYSLISLLTNHGFVVEEIGTDTNSWLGVEVITIGIDDEQLAVYRFNSNGEMQSAANNISPSGFSVDTADPHDEDVRIITHVSWVAYPFWFKSDRIIVRYVGENREVIEFLGELFGDTFAGLSIND